ncbi:hypothetical protein ABT390_27165 [Streptomyces aurantiacus]|uniref:hypothetical protein n=1 Tax=Streptomyces aurantiacus TaxID=47760 RepID=UPI00193976CA|nr:hypothetical protein [Streptomyces aurantiacus]
MSLAITAAGIGTGLMAASPAAAGGIIVIGSPSFNNGCANHQTHTQPRGTTSEGSGPAQGLLAQVPVTDPLNHCGGADLPIPSYDNDIKVKLLSFP